MSFCTERLPGRHRSTFPSAGHDVAHTLRIRLWILGIASSVGYLSVLIRLRRHPVFLRWGFPQTDFLLPFLVYFVFLFLLVLVAARWTFRAETDDWGTLRLILGFALLFRLVLLLTPPMLSSDIFRYVWDARVQASGGNPYLSAPAAFATEEVKQEPLYQQQNRPFAPTIYPPLAQIAFRAVRGVAGESVTAMKAIMVTGDLCTLALLVWLLPTMGLPRSRIILYAWHPLVVFECAGSGHVDALAVPLILLAVFAWQRNQRTMAGIALGAATLVKIYPVILLPAFFDRRRWQIPLACTVTIALGYLLFLPQAGLRVLGHLPRFLVDPNEVFNPSVMGLALFFGDYIGGAPIFWIGWIGRGVLLVMLIVLLRKEINRPSDLLGRLWVIGTGMTLLTLTLHPWYLLWLLPLLTIQPRAAWIYLSGAIALSYLFYVVPESARVAIGAVEYLPFLLLLGWQRGRSGTPTLKNARLGLEQV
jgi:alpha-1,6-mannosyltransferase